jgi:hypothetical protein
MFKNRCGSHIKKAVLDMEHLLLACDYKSSKIKVKIEEDQRVFTYHLGWMIPQKKKIETSCFCNQ